MNPHLIRLMDDETGSALFFRKCGDSCQLDSVTRTELSVLDCRFEPQTKFPGNFLDWINRFHPPASGGDDGDDGSEPERGDLPQKIPTASPSPSDFDADFDYESASSLPGEQQPGPSSSGGIAPFEYDYEENHRQEKEEASSASASSRRKRQQSRPFGDIDSILSHHLDPDEQLQVNEKDELPRTTSPHICFSSHLSTTTTCKIFFLSIGNIEFLAVLWVNE